MARLWHKVRGELCERWNKAVFSPSIFGLLLAACAGGGTDVENGIVRGVVLDNGTPVAGIQVGIMNAAYNPSVAVPGNFSMLGSSDAQGRFRFEGLAAGTYAVEARDPLNHTMDWLFDLEIEGDMVSQLRAELKPAKTIVLTLPDSLFRRDAYCYIPGSNSEGLAAITEPTEATVTLQFVPDTTIPGIYLGYRDQPNRTPWAFWGPVEPFVGDTLRLGP